MRYEILKDGEAINTIIADEPFVESYCAENGYTYELIPEPIPEPLSEPEPTQMDRIEAQVAYTAMMTNTLLEV